MPVLAFANPDAASGKTTSALVLAAYFGTLGARALVVDLDPNADATAAVGGCRTAQLGHLLRTGLPVSAGIGRSIHPRVDLMMASAETARTEAQLKEGTLSGLPRLLHQASAGYDYVLIDCPANLEPLTRAALEVADAIVVPIPAERRSVEVAPHFIEWLRGPDISESRGWLLLTMTRSGETEGVERDLRSRFSGAVLQTAIPSDPDLTGVLDRAPSFGRRSPGYVAYERLASEVAYAATGVAVEP